MWTILFIIVGIIATVALAAFALSTRENRTPFPYFPSVVMGIITILFVVFSSLTTVDARAVGIQTSFGKYAGTLQPGIQLIAPWSSVEEFTTRLQTIDLEGEQGTVVTFAGGGSGRVDATARWAISADNGDDGAKALWEKYRDFDTVTSTLVNREAKDAVLNVTNDYTPNDARTKQDEIAGKIKDRMVEKLSPYGIIVDSVSVLAMGLDDRTQQSLDKIVAAQNDVERAKADKQRAQIDNETAELRQKAGSLSAANMTRYCLEIVNSWDVAKNGPLPATFNCGMGANDTPVIIGSK